MRRAAAHLRASKGPGEARAGTEQSTETPSPALDTPRPRAAWCWDLGRMLVLSYSGLNPDPPRAS